MTIPALRTAASRLLRTQSLVELEALVPDLATGLRAALATVIPLMLAVRDARSWLAWMALGGWLGTLADPGGSRGSRARALGVFMASGALVVLGCEAGARAFGGATIFLASIAFFATMLRALGASASTLGTMLAIVAAIATSRRTSEPLLDAVGFAWGGALALVLSSIVWPVWTHLPLRRALAPVFRALADYARAIEACVSDRVPQDDPRWVEIARQHPRHVRDALEGARAMAVALHARRSGESAMGGNLRVLLGMAESQFLLLVSLATEVEAVSSSRGGAPLSALFAPIATAYDAVATVLLARAWRRTAVPADEENAIAIDGAPALAALLTEVRIESSRARTLVASLDRAADAIPWTAAVSLPSTAESFAANVRRFTDAFSKRSPIFRHAFRVGCASAVAAVVGSILSPGHAAWVSVTTIIVLQPHTGATRDRAVERMIGTTLGSFAAIAISAFVHRADVVAAIMFPLSIAAVATRPRSYRLFTFFLTPIFVLVAMRHPGDWLTGVERAADTLLGGLIAMASAFLVFPKWEGRFGLPEALDLMDASVRTYVGAVRATVVANGAPCSLDATRRAAAIAICEAETSLERFMGESPIPRREGEREARAMAQITYCRRLALAATTLERLASSKNADHARAVADAELRVAKFEALLDRGRRQPQEDARSASPAGATALDQR